MLHKKSVGCKSSSLTNGNKKARVLQNCCNVLPMYIISAWEGWLPGMTGEIQPLPTLSAWKQECSLCYHSGKFLIWPLGMTENPSDEKQGKNSNRFYVSA